MSKEFSRRRFIIGTGATVALIACDPGSVLQSEQDRKEDKENVPQMGDIIVVGSEAELLRGGMRYRVENVETYLRRSKSPGKIFRLQSIEAAKFFSQYPKGQVPGNYIIDIVQQDLKRINLQGGEKIIYAQGFLSADGRPFAQIIPRKDTFVASRKRLKSEGWDSDPEDIVQLDSYIFSYQEDELKTYGIGDTLRDPKINGDYAFKFIKKRVEQHPFDQHTGIGHSLGGLYLLKMAMEFPEAFNNLILVNVPIRGISWNPVREVQTQAIRGALKALGQGDEKVTDYLFKLWGDQDYQKKLRKFIADFTKSGRRIVIVYTKGDIIVPEESAVVEGAETLSVSVGNVNPFNPFEVFTAHGIAVKDEKVLTLNSKTVGKNLSTG